jgi:spermidine synthase
MEGMNASIAVSEFEDGTRNFHVSGKVVASTEPQDMRLQRMLCHIPTLLHPEPKSVLVVGCGAGVTAGSFLVHPTVERVVVCEIERLIPPAATNYFGDENYNLLNDPRVEVVYDDARHYVATTTERFDIITSDPIHPWVKGAAALYSKEYFELCKERLTPGGIVTQWVPLYEASFETVKAGIATFFEAFPKGSIWSNDQKGEGYDVILLGQTKTTTIDADELQLRLDRSDHQQVVESLAHVQLDSSLSLLMTYAGRATDLRAWLEGAEINHDRSLRLQYLAGIGLNYDEADWIYDSMVAYRRYPEDMFPANGVRGHALKFAFEMKDRAE